MSLSFLSQALSLHSKTDCHPTSDHYNALITFSFYVTVRLTFLVCSLLLKSSNSNYLLSCCQPLLPTHMCLMSKSKESSTCVKSTFKGIFTCSVFTGAYTAEEVGFPYKAQSKYLKTRNSNDNTRSPG